VGLYDALVHTYDNILSFFPADIQWAVTLVFMLLLIAFFIFLVRINPLFGLVVVVLLLIFSPVFISFIKETIDFFYHLAHSGGTSPATSPF
jgi:hypothetical protein